MPIFPFFQYPYNINRYYPRHNSYTQRNNNLPNTNVIENDLNKNINKDNQYNKEETKTTEERNYSKKQKSSRYSSFGPIYFQNPLSLDSNQPVLEILGISLYLDDLIILGLLFFLYQEGVKDDMLFLSLILLLLS